MKMQHSLVCCLRPPYATAEPAAKTFPSQLLVEETDALLEASLAAIRVELAKTPAWSGAPTPTDDLLLMFLRAEVFNPASAAKRYRKFWKVRGIHPCMVATESADIFLVVSR